MDKYIERDRGTHRREKDMVMLEIYLFRMCCDFLLATYLGRQSSLVNENLSGGMCP